MSDANEPANLKRIAAIETFTSIPVDTFAYDEIRLYADERGALFKGGSVICVLDELTEALVRGAWKASTSAHGACILSHEQFEEFQRTMELPTITSDAMKLTGEEILKYAKSIGITPEGK